MTGHTDLDNRLLEPLLRSDEDAAPPDGPSAHPDEELLALFAEGALDGTEHEQMVRHLSECAACRQIAGMVLRLPDTAVPVSRPGRSAGFSRTWTAWAPLAAAAAVLLMVAGTAGYFEWRRNPVVAERRAYAQAESLLKTGDYQGARTVISEANDRGVRSDRLRSLEAQALRAIPAPIALAWAGRLSDLGYEIGGIVARGPAATERNDGARRAYELLKTAGVRDTTVLLNRGHALLSLGQPAEALTEFRAAADRAPREPLAWLGLGLAQYALDDYRAADQSFRECLKLDPRNAAASINLAMTLEEEGDSAAALRLWEQLLATPLAEPDRAAIQREVEQLRQQKAR